MVEDRVFKCARHVADAAVLAGRHVAGMLAHRFHPVMAGGAIRRDAGMIENAGGERTGAVADTAIAGRGDMGARLAPRRVAVMAGSAVAGDSRMGED